MNKALEALPWAQGMVMHAWWIILAVIIGGKKGWELHQNKILVRQIYNGPNNWAGEPKVNSSIVYSSADSNIFTMLLKYIFI